MSGEFPEAVDRHLRTVLIDRAHALVLCLDAQWQLLDVRGDAVFWGFADAGRGSALEALRDIFIGIEPGVEHGLEFVELPDGRSAHLHLVPDGEGMHLVLLDARAYSERQRISQQLGNDAELASIEKSRAIGHLEQVRSELEHQRARLEEADALKNAFIATLSHEFRTPLTSIFGYLHLLERRLAEEHSAHHSLRAIRRGATHLFGLSENLLEYGRGDSTRFRLNPIRFEPRQLADDLRSMFAPLASEEGLSLDVQADSVPIPLIHDEVRVRQIMINLLSNAIRYTPSGSVRAHIRWDGHRLALDVADSGVGIPAEFQETVFKPFNAGGLQGSKGAGLGLSIVKRLVEQMRGSLTLASAAGEGTRFSVSLPPLGNELADAAAPRQIEDPASWLIGGDALVVDDDEDIRELVRTLLADMGFRVHTAADGSEGFEVAMRVRPDIAVVDVQMPGVSGNATVYRLRAHGYTGRIMSLSADDSAQARAAALAAGSDLYMTKPINIEQFMRAIRAAPRNQP